jgi:hypothetical protein
MPELPAVLCYQGYATSSPVAALPYQLCSSAAPDLTLTTRCVLHNAQNKDRVNMDLIKPAVDWRKTGVADASSSAAVARA